MTHKKKNATIAKAAKDLTRSIVDPLYPAALCNEEAAVELIDHALATHQAVSVWRRIPENALAKASMRLAMINLREAIEKYTDEKRRKEILDKIATLEEVTIGEKK